MATVAELTAQINFKIDPKAAQKAQKAFVNIGRGAAAFASKSAVGFGVVKAGVDALVVSTLKGVDANAKLAARLGVNSQELQSLEFAAGQAGVAAGVVGKSLQELSKRSSEAALGQGSAKDAFARLGIELRSQNGELKKSPALFRELAGRLKGLGRSEQIELADKIFGGEGVQVLQLLDKGSDGIANLQKEFKELGGTASDADEVLAARFTDNLGRLGAVVRSVGLMFSRLFGPGLLKATDAFIAFFKVNRQVIESGLGRIVQSWAKHFDTLREKVTTFFTNLNGVQKIVFGLAGTIAALGAAMSIPFLGPIVAAGALFVVLDSLFKYLQNDGVSVIDLLLIKFPELETAFAVVGAVMQTVWDIAEGTFTAFMVLFDAFTGGGTALDELISQSETLQNIWAGIQATVKSFVDFGDSIGNIAGIAANFLRGDISASEAFKAAGNTAIGGAFTGAAGDAAGSTVSTNNNVNIEIRTDNPAAAGNAVTNSLRNSLQNSVPRS